MSGDASSDGAWRAWGAWRDWLDEAAAGTPVRWRPELVPALEAALAAQPAPADAESELVGRPCPVPPQRWHLQGLEASLAAAGAEHGAAAHERARYHARWLRHLLDPGDPAQRPLVSVVVPVFNDAGLVVEAVQSCLAQTHPRLEVVVVDDGSLDDPASRLAPLDTPARPVRVLTQPNRGVASARQRGVSAARGELVHFLDADDLLHPEALERKIAALRRVPDAELCVSRYRCVGAAPGRGVGDLRIPDFGGAVCPTRDPVGAAVRRYPFHTSTVLLARWVALETGPWDAELRHGSDQRYWLRLALRGTRVVALRDALAVRRLRPGSLTTHRRERRPYRAAVLLRAVLDLLERPDAWLHLGPLLRRAGHRGADVLAAPTPPGVADRREELLEAVAKLPASAERAGLSARPVLALLEHHLPLPDPRAARGSPEGAGLGARLETAVRDAWDRSPPPGPADAALWRGAADERASRPALAVLTSGDRRHPGRTVARLWRRLRRRDRHP